MDNTLNIKNKKVKFILLQVFLLMLGVVLVLIDIFLIRKLNIECAYKSILGLPCISCGGTRCLRSILTLNFVEAFKLHPTFFLLFFYLVFVDLIYFFNTLFDKKIFIKLYPSLKIFYIFLSLFVIQYIVRLTFILNGIEVGWFYSMV